MILKTNLHFHTANDEKIACYDIYQGIDYAQKQGFDVLAYTSHRKFKFKQDYADYAAEKGILLIPGIEMEIKNKHIVVLNCNKEIESIKSFLELVDYKRKNPQIFVLAAHPFVWSPKSLRSKLLTNINLFDAIELTVFSNKIFNFNKKSQEVAEKYQKPLIATSDTHFLKDLKRGYSLIDSEEKTAESIFTGIRKGDFQNRLNSMDLFAMAEFQVKSRFYSIFNPAKQPTV